MDPEHFESAARIFSEVCDLGPEDRARALAAACGDDPGLRRMVEELLEGDARPVALGRPAVERHAADITAGWSEAKDIEVPGYRLERVLGSGGMGIVFEAEQEYPKRRVALKLINPLALSDESLRRFQHEVALLARLDHPGIARIFDAGSTPQGRPYFTLELVEGQPITGHARTVGLSVTQRLELMAEVCDAVDHAHGIGVVHRDLKPANVLIQRGGRPRILDFGIARTMGEGEAGGTMLTATGQLIGTLAYMSPEQAGGERIDGRSDVYSLGVMLYELISGQPPYEVSGLPLHEAVRVIRQAEPTKLSGTDTRSSRDVATIVRKAMEKVPGRRYRTAADLASDIRRFLADEPIVARPASRAYQTAKFVRRHRALASGALVAFLALSIGTAIALNKAAEAVAARDDADRQLARARRESYRANLAGAQAFSVAGDPERARALLENVPEDERGWEYHHLTASLDCASLLVSFPGETLLDAALTGDGRLAAVTASGSLPFYDARLGDLVEERSLGDGAVAQAALTRSGERLAYAPADSGVVHVLELESGEVLGTVDASSGAVSELEWQLDGSLLAILGPGRTWVWSAEGGGHAPPAVGFEVCALPTGEWLCGADTTHVCRGVHPPPESRPVFGRGWHHSDVAVSADGRWAVGGGPDKVLELADLETGESSGVANHRHPIRSVDLTRDGQIAAVAAGQNAYLYDLRTGDQLASLVGHTSNVRSVRFSRDERELVTRDADSVRRWELGPAAPSLRLGGHSGSVYAVTYLPGGQQLASVAWDGTLRLWSSSGESLGIMAEGLGNLRALAIPEEGDRAYLLSRGDLFACDLTGERPLELVEPDRTRPWLAGFAEELDVSPDGSRLALSSVYTSRLVDAASWDSPAILHTEMRTRAVRFSPDGRMLAAGHQNGPATEVQLLDARTGLPIRALAVESTPHSLAFSPGGEELAVGDDRGEIAVFSTGSGERRLELLGHANRVFALAYSPDGARLASSGEDNGIRIWDTVTGDLLLSWTPGDSYVKTLAFSPDGCQLASGSGDGGIALWDTRPRHELERARAGLEHLRTEIRAGVLAAEEGASSALGLEALAQVRIQNALARRASAGPQTPRATRTNPVSVDDVGSEAERPDRWRYDFDALRGDDFGGEPLAGQDDWGALGGAGTVHVGRTLGPDGSPAAYARRRAVLRRPLPPLAGSEPVAYLQADLLVVARGVSIGLATSAGELGPSVRARWDEVQVAFQVGAAEEEHRAISADIGDWVRVRLTLDLTAADGAGRGHLHALSLTRGQTEFERVTPPEGLELGVGSDGAAWDTLCLSFEGAYGVVDNIEIGLR